jgi:O-methyltransferase
MNFSPYQWINFLLILIFLILLVRYFWDMLSGTANKPAAWKNAVKKGNISNRLQKAERMYPDKVRFFNWWFQVEELKKKQVLGTFAELGVYKGDSARILHQLDPERVFHLFDTFEGFSAPDLENETGEAATYTPRNFADTTVDKVRNHIDGNKNIIFHKGHFPETTYGLENELFALVNLDADLYKPTIAGLRFFYPRLSPGGVIFIHDYNDKWEGIKQAVDEFCILIEEPMIRISDREGTIMIIKNKKK